MNSQKENKSNGFFGLIKNLFILLLFLQFAPGIISNIKNSLSEILTPKSKVGYLRIAGVLEDSSYYVKEIHKFLRDPNIKGLLIKLDSPGGLPGTSQAIFNELNKLKKEKPVVTLVENICASGGYYVACASNHIISAPSALIGSVGVLLNLPNVKDLLESWKIKFNYIQTGKFKTAGSPLKNNTPEELAYLQNLSDQNYAQFTKDVATSRNLNLKNTDKWANGKVFLGSEALKLNLVDQLGSQQEAIDKIKELAKIVGEVAFIKPPRPSVLSQLFGDKEDSDVHISNYSENVATFMSDVYKKFMEKQTRINISSGFTS